MLMMLQLYIMYNILRAAAAAAVCGKLQQSERRYMQQLQQQQQQHATVANVGSLQVYGFYIGFFFGSRFPGPAAAEAAHAAHH